MECESLALFSGSLLCAVKLSQRGENHDCFRWNYTSTSDEKVLLAAAAQFSETP
jgi:hypothetical protein